MSEDNKPKKDLRARLGKTIAPTTQGAPPIAAPAMPGAGPMAPSPVAPPSLGGSPAFGSPAPASGVSAVPSLPFGGPPDVAPPPFAQPAAKPAEPAKIRPPADPFASGPSAEGPREVRLVFDDKPVDEGEIGRKQRGRTFLFIGVGLVAGLAFGGAFGSWNSTNVLYNVTVRDGHEIYATIDTASRTVSDAQTKIDHLVERAAGAGGQAAGVDYATIEQLRALEAPIDAGAFSRKNYGAFMPGTVDDLFAYYNNVQQLWQRFERLAATTLPEARRTELDRTATAAAESATAQYGIIPVSTEQGIRGTLVFIEVPAAPAEGAAASTKLTARPRRGGPGRELEMFTAETEIGDNASSVMVLDGAQSAGVLAEQLGAFRSYVNELREIKTLMDQTVEIQGRLTTSLGEIARLNEVFAL